MKLARMRTKLPKESQREFIHPYDDFEVIAGQRHYRQRIIRTVHQGKIDAIFIPVGGRRVDCRCPPPG